MRRLHEMQQQMGEDIHELIQDCATRWNSEYSMLARLLLHKISVSAVLVDVPGIRNLAGHEWILVDSYVKLLQPFDEATTQACSDTLPTLSAVIPIIHGLTNYLDNYLRSESHGKEFARGLASALKSRFPQCKQIGNNAQMMAMLLDARYKDIVLDEVEKKMASDVLTFEAKKYGRSQPSEVGGKY